MPPEWEVYAWAAQGEHPNWWGVKLSGAVPRLLTRGPNKGHKTFRDMSMARSYVVPDTALRVWLDQWERDTGYCHVCEGTGLRDCGWTRYEGAIYRPCLRCEETGKAPQANPGTARLLKSEADQ